MTGEDDDMQGMPMAISRVETARRLSLSVRSIDRAIARGELKARQFGGRVLVPVSEIERYLDALAAKGPRGTPK
jgi:excisionase family DNA binding protein